MYSHISKAVLPKEVARMRANTGVLLYIALCAYSQVCTLCAQEKSASGSRPRTLNSTPSILPCYIKRLNPNCGMGLYFGGEWDGGTIGKTPGPKSIHESIYPNVEWYLEPSHKLLDFELLKRIGNRVGESSATGLSLEMSVLSEAQSFRDQPQLFWTPLSTLTNLRRLNLSTIRDTPEGLRVGNALQSIAKLRNLECLNLDRTEVDDSDIAHLNSLPSLRSLSVTGAPITDTGVKSICKLDQLESLRLRGTLVTNGSISHVVKLSKLLSLDISYTDIDADTCSKLGACQQLESLDLSGTRANDSTVASICELQKLKELSLEGLKISDVSIKAVSKMSSVEYLSVASTSITSTGVSYLRDLRGLKSVDLSECVGISDAEVDVITQLPKLTFLALDGCRVSDASLKSIARLSQMSSLDLSDLNISDQGIRELESMKQLATLSLCDTFVTDKSIEVIAKLHTIRNLMLDGTLISDKCMQLLAGMPNLEVLTLSRTSISDVGLGRLSGSRTLRVLHLFECPQVTKSGLRKIGDFQNLCRLHVGGVKSTEEINELKALLASKKGMLVID